MSNYMKAQAAVEAVEEFCGPKQMSKLDAVDFLEDVIAMLQSSIEALREEMKEG